MQTVNTAISPEVNEHQLVAEVALKTERFCYVKPNVVGWEVLCFELK